MTTGSLKHLTTTQRLRIKMGTDERHERVAKEFTNFWNGLDGEYSEIDACVSRVLKDGILCKDKRSAKYFMVIKTNGVVGGYALTLDEVNKYFIEYKNSIRPWAERFKNNRLYRKALFNEASAAI